MKLKNVATVILQDGRTLSTKSNNPDSQTHSKMLEYSSCLAANNWITINAHPRGNEISESMKDPLKLTLQIDAEHMPPKKMSCHLLYSGGLRISVSSSDEASFTEVSS